MKKFIFALIVIAAGAICSAASGKTSEVKEQYRFLTDQYNMFNIVPMSIGGEEILARNLIELHQRTGIDTMLYCMSLAPRSSTPYQTLDSMIESYRKLKKHLAGTPIKTGVLIQSILGHVTNPTVVIDGWTRSYTSLGNTPRFCVFNKNFADYIRTVGKRLAQEKPCFILGDDDIRLNSYGLECFCQLHVDKFNSRHNTKYTPDSLRKAVLNAKNSDKIYVDFRKLALEGLHKVGYLIREGIDSVDPTIPGGTCCPGGMYFDYHELTRIMAANGQPPMMRVGNAHYIEESPFSFAYSVLRTQLHRKHFRALPSLFDESDTFPHSTFSKSAISFHAKQCSAIFNGLKGSKLWYVNCDRKGMPVSRKYTDILARHRDFYPALFKTVADTTDCGVRIPGFSSGADWHLAHRTHGVIPKEDDNWAFYLGIGGIPFTGEVDFNVRGVYALRGKTVVERLSDAELLLILRNKVLVDGAAAQALNARGLGKYIGVKTVKPDSFFRGEYYLQSNKYIYCRSWQDAPLLVVEGKDAKVLTTIQATTYAVTKDRDRVVPGSVLFENSLGGKIITTAFMSREVFSLRAGMPRKKWLIYLLEQLAPEVVQGTVLNDSPVLSVKRVAKDGSTVIMICNLGYDAMDNIELKFDKFKKIEQLSVDGIWEKANFRKEKGRAVIKCELPCYGIIVLKVK